MNKTSKLYYESHVTIEPVFGSRLSKFKEIAEEHKFRVAELLMKKDSTKPGVPNQLDSFCTSRNSDWDVICNRTTNLVRALRQEGFRVFRYKIEDTLLDSKIEDAAGLLA